MPTGSVKWFNSLNGYGFIIPDDGGPDVFVHATSLEHSRIDVRSVSEGDRLSYDIGPSRGGKTQAKNLMLLADAEAK